MIELKLLSAGLIAAAMLSTPVMARKRHLNARRVATAQHPPGVSNHVSDFIN
jgi:hypothetical protein